jgi:hypothetical protein
MAIPIIKTWKSYFNHHNEGLGSSYERIILNKLLLKLKSRYDLQSVLEVPVFGFTGLTGLNSYALCQAGCDVILLDHDEERIALMNGMFHELDTQISAQFISSYTQLPFTDKRFDLGWNFSALWFTEDLPVFLRELTRVTRKAILICVPNQSGLGYKWQKANAEIPCDVVFHEEHINPDLIKMELANLGWHFIHEDFIDCPPWPDIGMSKEDLLGGYLKKIHIKLPKSRPTKPVCILDYYSGKDPGFADRMEKLSSLERHAPRLFRKYWSHHHWMLFESPR